MVTLSGSAVFIGDFPVTDKDDGLPVILSKDVEGAVADSVDNSVTLDDSLVTEVRDILVIGSLPYGEAVVGVPFRVGAITVEML